MAAAERREVLDIPLTNLYKAITDYSSYPEFVSGVKATKVLSNGGNKKKVHFDMEMVKRLQYVVEVSEEFDAEKGEAKIWWSLVESSFFKVNNGWWSLKSLGPKQTEVTYKIELDFAFPVPGFVLKGLISNNLPAAIRDFSRRAETAV